MGIRPWFFLIISDFVRTAAATIARCCAVVVQSELFKHRRPMKVR
jgi:hypothetical protein